MTPTPQERTELQLLAEAAPKILPEELEEVEMVLGPNRAAYIAAANPTAILDLLSLAAESEELRAENERLKEELKELGDELRDSMERLEGV